MTLAPAAQARARQEINRVAGTGRFPEFKDQGNMPYINAVVLESLRWNPPAPFSTSEKARSANRYSLSTVSLPPLVVPHASREDDTYNGYFIPKGTMVIPNVWCATVQETCGSIEIG